MTKVIFKPNYNYNDFFFSCFEIRAYPCKPHEGITWSEMGKQNVQEEVYFEFLNLDFKRQLDFSLSENIMCDLHIHHSRKSNNTVVVLNDQIFKKALFRFQTTNWYLLSVLWLLINFPGKKIAAPQSQQDKVQKITFASKQIN